MRRPVRPSRLGRPPCTDTRGVAWSSSTRRSRMPAPARKRRPCCYGQSRAGSPRFAKAMELEDADHLVLAHRCDRPTTVDVRRKRRAYDRSETIFRWALRLAVDGTGALVAVGDEDERPRWVLLRRHGGVRKSGTAPTQAFRAGLAYARTASGQDWAAWSDVTQNSWVGRLTDRAKLRGTLIASNADTIRLRSSSHRLCRIVDHASGPPGARGRTGHRKHQRRSIRTCDSGKPYPDCTSRTVA